MTAHAGAFTGVIFTPWSALAQAAVASVLTLSLIFYGYGFFSIRHAHQPTRLVWGSEGAWTVQFASGKSFDADLLPGAFAHPWLVVVPLKTGDGKKLSVAIFADAADAETLRRLRIRLASYDEKESSGAANF